MELEKEVSGYGRARLGGRELPIPRLDEAGLSKPEAQPLAGEWGYTREKACTVTDDLESKEEEGRAREFMRVFIRSRLCAELDSAPEVSGQLVCVRWEAWRTALHRNPDGTPTHEHFTVVVRAFQARDYDGYLEDKAALGHDGDGHKARRALWKAFRSKELWYARDCWFDVSRIKDIADKPQSCVRVYKGRVISAREQEDYWSGARARPGAGHPLRNL